MKKKHEKVVSELSELAQTILDMGLNLNIEKTKQAVNEKIALIEGVDALMEEVERARQKKTEDGKTGADKTKKIKQKEIKKRQSAIKTLCDNERFINEWRSSEVKSFVKYLHDYLPTESERYPEQLRKDLKKYVLPYKVDVLRADLKTLRINPKKKP